MKLFSLEVEQSVTERGFIQIMAENEEEARHAFSTMPRAHLSYIAEKKFSPTKILSVQEKKELAIPEEE